MNKSQMCFTEAPSILLAIDCLRMSFLDAWSASSAESLISIEASVSVAEKSWHVNNNVDTPHKF